MTVHCSIRCRAIQLFPLFPKLPATFIPDTSLAFLQSDHITMPHPHLCLDAAPTELLASFGFAHTWCRPATPATPPLCLFRRVSAQLRMTIAPTAPATSPPPLTSLPSPSTHSPSPTTSTRPTHNKPSPSVPIRHHRILPTLPCLKLHALPVLPTFMPLPPLPLYPHVVIPRYPARRACCH